MQRCMSLLKRVALNVNGAAATVGSDDASAPAAAASTAADDAGDAAARKQLLKEMSELWFPDSPTPVAPALLVEHICEELLRATMLDVSSLVRDRWAELETPSDTTDAAAAAVAAAEVDDGTVTSEEAISSTTPAQPFTLDTDAQEDLREKCLQLDEQLSDLLDLWDPKAVIPDPP